MSCSKYGELQPGDLLIYVSDEDETDRLSQVLMVVAVRRDGGLSHITWLTIEGVRETCRKCNSFIPNNWIVLDCGEFRGLKIVE